MKTIAREQGYVSPSGEHRSRLATSDVEFRSRSLLNTTYRELTNGDFRGLDRFAVELKSIRDEMAPGQWKRFIDDVVASHPILPIMHEDPFTRRAFAKPRGYPGDAELLDLIYRDEPFAGRLTRRAADL